MLIRSNRNRVEACLHRQAGFKSENDPSKVGMLNIAADSRSMFRRRAPRLLPSGDPSAFDKAFETLLSDASRELSSLLQEVSVMSDDTRQCVTPSQPISELLRRAVGCATKQSMLLAELGNLALTDELTGLYNRRGFMAIAQRQLKIGQRSRRGMLLFFIDVDGLKQINDSFGHSEGDRVLERTAQALEMTFRDSDVIARMAGDEFAVLAIEAAGHSEAVIRTRLNEDLNSISEGECRYGICLSVGVARFDPRDGASIGELMVQADQSMYEEKRRHSMAAGIDSRTNHPIF